MAFPIPSHLPRRSASPDVSSKIISKFDEATHETLNATLAASWLTELDETILLTKERIHQRIQSDLPLFEQQLHSAKSVQTRLQSLAEKVEVLGHAVSHPETGCIPILLGALTTHASLLQETSNSTVAYEVFSHLLRIKAEFSSLSSLVQAGKLPDAAKACEGLELRMNELPTPLNQANVTANLKRSFRATKDRIEEQLSDAYSRSITITPSELTVRPSIQVQQSETILSLSAILSSLSAPSISSHLTSLRRDLTIHYIDRILTQPTSMTQTVDQQEYKLTLFPSPPNNEIHTARLRNLVILLTFLNNHVFPCLPEVQRESFPRSLCKPLTTGILNHLLIPLLPSSFSHLPSFLDLVKRAVEFEEENVVGVLGNPASDKTIKTWADGVGGHYERKRRLDILEKSRVIIIRADGESRTFSVEVEPGLEHGDTQETTAMPTESNPTDGESWGFDDDENTAEADSEENSWGFDDDVALQEEENPQSQSSHDPPADDPTAAWGWNDDEAASETDHKFEETVWDDPWDDEPNTEINASGPPAASTMSTPHLPKAAAGLEKLTSKNKKAHSNGNLLTSPSSVASSKGSESVEPAKPLPAGQPLSVASKETYLISGHIKELVRIIEEVLKEGRELASSRIVVSPLTSNLLPGSLILQSAVSILDLFRALYPVKFSSELASPERSMRFFNDCIYLSGEVAKIQRKERGLVEVTEKLAECKDSLKILGDSWFDGTIEKQRQFIDNILKESEGFTCTTEQDRYDECENAITQVLRHIRLLSQRWKGVLALSKYYIALGLVADAALSRILQDILALPDITAEESHRLSELCRIFNSLEGLFFVNMNEPSLVVAYVPSWLKFSYLSELLEASIADISYLFEEGALVDFEVDELVTLVRALFADTPLRASTINKLLGRHPVRNH